MSILFQSTSINGMALGNRFVRSATWEGLANDDGTSNPRLMKILTDLAGGGVGLIITSHAYVSPEGQAGSWQLGIYSDDHIPGLAEMTKIIHGIGSKIVLQIAHSGARASSRLTGMEAIGPSPLETESGPVGREMTRDEIRAVTEAFVRAAIRARRAGFDGTQIHGAHGYLLSQFLSPFFNKRKDEYGGAIENRARLAVEVLKAIRTEIGRDYPVLIKLNAEDFLPGGLSVEEMLRTAEMLEEVGIDAVEMSGGTFQSGKNNPSRRGTPGPGEPEAYYEAAARAYKQKVRTPLILVGGLRSFENSERLISEGVADYIAMCRPFICEPGLVNRWKSGDRRPAFCVSDSGCFGPALKGEGIRCVVNKKPE
jgi:2,4-dienoyl-CoA reductase-like NADH-dependent reductase (Old Yellow Enzyme family)